MRAGAEGTASGFSAAQEADRAAFREFAGREIAPEADRFDRDEAIPLELVRRLGERGYLGSALPAAYGGGGRDWITYGLLTEEVGQACSSVRSLLTVHDMVGEAIARWGTRAQRERWLPGLVSGRTVAAFALSEPDVGSDAAGVQTAAREDGSSYALSGQKKWISFGQIADLFLVFARCQGKMTAFLVERNTDGLSVEPITGLLGTRASMLAEVRLDDCRIPRENLLGALGAGLSHVAATALAHGRYSVAWGCVGIGQGCLESSLAYSAQRRQFGAAVQDHQLVSRMITDMITDVQAGRLLCLRAGELRDAGQPEWIFEAMLAKYFTSRMALRSAADAVQIHGANGCSGSYPVARYFRDAKIMEIIEGSSEILQFAIARHGPGARADRKATE